MVDSGDSVSFEYDRTVDFELNNVDLVHFWLTSIHSPVNPYPNPYPSTIPYGFVFFSSASLVPKVSNRENAIGVGSLQRSQGPDLFALSDQSISESLALKRLPESIRKS